MEVIQLTRGCRMQPTMARTLMRLMLMSHKHTPIIITWHNMVVYLGYRNTTDTVPGKKQIDDIDSIWCDIHQVDTHVFK